VVNGAESNAFLKSICRLDEPSKQISMAGRKFFKKKTRYPEYPGIALEKLPDVQLFSSSLQWFLFIG
jgi:hypothetical protein